MPMKLRLFRYRLSTLLGVMVVIALTAASYGNHLRAIQQQEKAFRQIAAKGGCVLHYEEGAYIEFGQPIWTGLCGTGLHGVFKPTEDSVTFSDRDMPLLDKILKIRTIDFTDSQVSSSVQDSFKKTHKDCTVTP